MHMNLPGTPFITHSLSVGCSHPCANACALDCQNSWTPGLLAIWRIGSKWRPFPGQSPLMCLEELQAQDFHLTFATAKASSFLDMLPQLPLHLLTPAFGRCMLHVDSLQVFKEFFSIRGRGCNAPCKCGSQGLLTLCCVFWGNNSWNSWNSWSVFLLLAWFRLNFGHHNPRSGAVALMPLAIVDLLFVWNPGPAPGLCLCFGFWSWLFGCCLGLCLALCFGLGSFIFLAPCLSLSLWSFKPLLVGWFMPLSLSLNGLCGLCLIQMSQSCDSRLA